MSFSLRCRSSQAGRPDRLVPEGPGSVFQQLRRAQVPIASSCLGEAVCGRCVVEVVEGEVTPTTPDERVRLEILGLTGVRLACRLRARGPGVVLRTTYW